MKHRHRSKNKFGLELATILLFWIAVTCAWLTIPAATTGGASDASEATRRSGFITPNSGCSFTGDHTRLRASGLRGPSCNLSPCVSSKSDRSQNQRLARARPHSRLGCVNWADDLCPCQKLN